MVIYDPKGKELRIKGCRAVLIKFSKIKTCAFIYPLRVLHTPGKSSAYNPILLNYLKIWISSKRSNWKWQEKFNLGEGNQPFKILPLFMKIKVPAVFELGTCELVDLSYNHCATEIDIVDLINCFTMRYNRYVVTYCHKKVEVTGYRGFLSVCDTFFEWKMVQILFL